MRPILIILFFLLTYVSAKSQDWEPGYIYDTTGIKHTGLIHLTDKSPIKDEHAVVFKRAKDSLESYYTASGLQSFIMGRDSFVVAAKPNNATWNYYYDFVQVVIDGDQLKLYAYYNNSEENANGRSSGSRFSLGFGLGAGFGGGYNSHFGGGVDAGFAIPLGGGNRNYPTGTMFYYGTSTAHMRLLTSQNFIDIMTEMLGDEQLIADKLHAGKYNIGNIDKLLRDYYKQQSKHPVSAQ